MLKHWFPKGREFIRWGHDAQFVGRIGAPNGSKLGKSSWKNCSQAHRNGIRTNIYICCKDALTQQ